MSRQVEVDGKPRVEPNGDRDEQVQFLSERRGSRRGRPHPMATGSVHIRTCLLTLPKEHEKKIT